MTIATPSPVFENPYPWADTDAAICLRSALDRLKREQKKSLRSVARELNYKQPVTLSHMANGRMPIPVERAREIASAVNIDGSMFINLVLKQKYPNLNVCIADESLIEVGLADEFGAHSAWWGRHPLTASQERVVREVIRDERAAERWLSPHEVDVIQLLRRLRPNITLDGLNELEIEQLTRFLQR